VDNAVARLHGIDGLAPRPVVYSHARGVLVHDPDGIGIELLADGD